MIADLRAVAPLDPNHLPAKILLIEAFAERTLQVHARNLNSQPRYSHRRLHDFAGAVEKPPNLIPGNTSELVRMQATGTGPVCTQFAQTPCKTGSVAVNCWQRDRS